MIVKSHTKSEHSLKIFPFKNNGGDIMYRHKKAMLVPAANVDETDNEYILTIASPGFKRENFQVLIEKNIISTAATKDIADENCIHDRCEYDYSRWKRDFLLPDDADALMTVARYKNGELIIRIPKGNKDILSGITNIYVY
jgi:HSP20 family protein